MAGIYFHIPFCKTRCTYCDFYTTTEISQLSIIADALIKELKIRKDEIFGESVSTIYFGGGTPTLLKAHQIGAMINSIYELFDVDDDIEISVEANPDDLNSTFLMELKNQRVNRLSIGIQSFSDQVLKFMNRRHNSNQAKLAVELARNAGFSNISIDLIYGIPNVSDNEWISILNQAFSLNVEHISAYHLTYHENTKLWNQLQKGIIKEIDEEASVRQFEMLVNKAREKGYIHYEISNFAREGYYSRHNSSYWNQISYLGIGPSAHSYNKTTRRWNESNLKNYLDGVFKGKIPYESEILTVENCYNEFLITTMRTIWGTDLEYIQNKFGIIFYEKLINKMQKFIDSEHLYIKGNKIYFTSLGLFISDHILSELIE